MYETEIAVSVFYLGPAIEDINGSQTIQIVNRASENIAHTWQANRQLRCSQLQYS